MHRHPESGGTLNLQIANAGPADVSSRWSKRPVRRLFVRPFAAAWWVDAEGLQPLSFSTCAQAEQQAHALARGFVAAGFDASIHVHDAAQVLVGTVIYYAAEVALAAGCEPPRAAPRTPTPH